MFTTKYKRLYINGYTDRPECRVQLPSGIWRTVKSLRAATLRRINENAFSLNHRPANPSPTPADYGDQERRAAGLQVCRSDCRADRNHAAQQPSGDISK